MVRSARQLEGSAVGGFGAFGGFNLTPRGREWRAFTGYGFQQTLQTRQTLRAAGRETLSRNTETLTEYVTPTLGQPPQGLKNKPIGVSLGEMATAETAARGIQATTHRIRNPLTVGGVS